MPADGFYEWPENSAARYRTFFRRPDDAPIVFAGIWERWQPGEGAELVETCCQLTPTPNDLMRPIHDRMPVILHSRDYAQWLDPDAVGDDVTGLLRPLPDGELEAYAVSTAVNSVQHNGPKTGHADDLIGFDRLCTPE